MRYDKIHQVYLKIMYVWPKLRDQVAMCWLEKELSWPTLESELNIAPWINVAPESFYKCSPIYTLYFYCLNRLNGIRNKAVATG